MNDKYIMHSWFRDGPFLMILFFTERFFCCIHSQVFSWIETGLIAVVVIIACVYVGLRIPRHASHDPLQW